MRKILVTALAAVAALLSGAGVAAADDNTAADRNHEQSCEVNGISLVDCADARDLLDLHNLLHLQFGSGDDN